MLIDRLPRPIFFAIAFILGVALYWRAFNGLPIWDDLAFWFLDPSIEPSFPYSHIWKTYNWPLSVSIQKFSYGLIGDNYFIYHLLNWCLHVVNSLLVYRLSKKLKWPSPEIIFLLFLIHPANTISVAWMIQFKTLICFLFSILSFMAFEKGVQNKKWFLLSFLFYFLSLISKSSSVTLPFLFLIFGYKELRHKVILILIPFFILGGMASYRLVNSPATLETVNLIENAKTDDSAKTEYIDSPKETPATEVQPGEVITPPQKVISEKQEPTSSRLNLILKTLRYYFWETLLPIDNHPIKGPGDHILRAFDIIALLGIVASTFLFYKIKAIWFFISGLVLLTPYMGIVLAPYMNITWVSDQHLYLALPLFLMLWVSLIDKLPKKLPIVFLALIALFFSLKTYEATAYYTDEVTFYEASLAYDPYNVPVVYNLADSLAAQGQTEEAFMLVEDLILKAKEKPELQRSSYWPALLELKEDLDSVK